MKTILRTLPLLTLAMAVASCGSGRASGGKPVAAVQASASSSALSRSAAPAGLTALSAIAGVPAWSTTGGNAGHANYVPASFDPARFSRRFAWALPGGASVSQAQLALDQGLAFAVVQDATGQWSLRAIDEATGKESWHTALGKFDIVDPPATHEGKVVLSTQAGTDGDALMFFDQRTGALLDKRTIPSRRTPGHSTADMRMAPVIAGGGIYVNDRGAGKLIAKFDAATHELLWESDWTGAPNHALAPAIERDRVYVSLSDGGLAGFDAASGKQLVDHHRQFTDSPMDGMVADGAAYALSRNGLVATSLGQGSFRWQGPVLLSMAAPPGAVLYGVANGAIQAIDRATGKILWSMASPAPTSVSNPVLATKNLLFVSSYPQNSMGTYAIDISARKVVWSCQEGGWLSISPNGVLYITPPSGEITAVNLK
ncbi:PQQ-binding-like beta-propeller repeat protein [Massilia sp. LXY-6]|uniref:PQQ-binding-like beta-propeller repeat protein n=1 Tax=Massilia sp. LXY-6 TaxID=3379823 RepID=UPI003EE11FA0